MFFLKITFVLLNSILIVNSSVIRYHNIELNSIDDTPSGTDLMKYFNTINGILRFCLLNPNLVDFNLMIGLFLMAANLKHADQSKANTVTSYIIDELLRNERLVTQRFTFLMEENIKEGNQYFTLLNLFKDYNSWQNKIRDFHIVSKCTKCSVLPSWDNYKSYVMNLEEATPNPNQSDFCFKTLVQSNLVSYSALNERICEIPLPCSAIIINGTNFGYALSHRLFFLTTMNLGLRCSLVSQLEDQKMINELCALAATETEYIARNNFDIPDLFMEFVAICSLNGHRNFIQTSWLDNIIKLKTVNGCFARSVHAKDDANATFYSDENENAEDWKFMRNANHDVFRGACNMHVTGVAAAALGAAARFVIENQATIEMRKHFQGYYHKQNGALY